MKTKRHLKSWGLLLCVLAVLSAGVQSSADWMKMDPPPDVDKAAHGHTGTSTCWLATAANMLAGAGYGDGSNVQERADKIYDQLVANFGTGGGWTDTALSWWLSSAHNPGGNPYSIVSVFGNKIPKYPWSDSNGANYIANELRRCELLGLSISWPTSGSSVGTGGHAITCWGDNGDKNPWVGNPASIFVSDSDRDNGGDVQGYTYDLFTNPNPGGANEGNGWYFNYSADHPYIKHIVTLCPTDDPTDRILTQKVVGSYRIHQNSRLGATDLHYKVNSTKEVLTYKTTIDFSTEKDPQIIETGKPRTGIEVDWDFSENRIPYCTWVTITTEFVLPFGNYIAYDDVYFTYPDIIFKYPYLIWEVLTPEIDVKENIPNICGGYVIGSFDLLDPKAQDGPTIIAEYRFIHEYDYNQNPELHDFQLFGPVGLLAENLRFGHSYGMPDPEGLWEFKDWKTRLPDTFEMNPEEPIKIRMDWDGLLPYPPGEDYLGELKPPECTVFLKEDLNEDCYVNILDFRMLAEKWLMSTIP